MRLLPRAVRDGGYGFRGLLFVWAGSVPIIALKWGAHAPDEIWRPLMFLAGYSCVYLIIAWIIRDARNYL